MLVFHEKVPKHFWRIAIVTRILPSRDSEIRGATVRIRKTNTIFKCPVNKLFAVKNTYHDTNQTDKASYREIASPFPCCTVNHEYSWKKTYIEKKANSALQHLRFSTEIRSMMGEESLVICMYSSRYNPWLWQNNRNLCIQISQEDAFN